MWEPVVLDGLTLTAMDRVGRLVSQGDRDGLTHTQIDLTCLSADLSVFHCLTVAACSDERAGALRRGFASLVRVTREGPDECPVAVLSRRLCW